jgi:hypothetical protein
MPRWAIAITAFVLGATLAGSGSRVPFATAQEATAAADCPVTTTQENEATALRWHEEAINGGDLGVIDEIVATDVVHHAGTFPDGVGPEAVKTVLGALLSGFPDVRHTVEDVVSAGDEVVIRWSATGAHDGEFQGYAPTGKQVTWTGVNIFRFV